jgi:putative DNA methylase
MTPVNPESRANGRLKTWRGAEGLAEDVRYYGAWMREEAKKRIGHLYPEVELPKGHGRAKATVIAWLWTRTVESPNPAFKGCHVPLVTSYWLSTKPGKETWIEPEVEGKTYTFRVRSGKPSDAAAIGTGTKAGRAVFKCLLSGAVISGEYIDAEANAGRMRARLMAVVVEGQRSRIYLPVSPEQERLALEASTSMLDEALVPREAARGTFAGNAQGRIYGFKTFGDYFSVRQLVALTTFSQLVLMARERVVSDLASIPVKGLDAQSYGDAVAVYLSFAVDKTAEALSTLCSWSSAPKNELVVSTFRRQALAIAWDFAEANPFGNSSGSFEKTIASVARVVAELRGTVPGRAFQRDAQRGLDAPAIVATDPPYYDNIVYADLADFLYVWMRRSLRARFPEDFTTLLAPKDDELVATQYRHGSKDAAEEFFLNGMRRALIGIAAAAVLDAPQTIYYAFRQSESDESGASSTGWETFLEAVDSAGLAVDGTWPIRTERAGRSTGIETNALASSVVLVCRVRPDNAPSTTRGEFRRLLRKELPDALKKLQQGNIAPVDVAQASIGPGMAIFSRHKQVAEADGKPMRVRSALQLINEVLDEYLSSGEGDFDGDTRFAITWYEQHGWDAGPFGEAETLAKARNVSVNGVVEAGICKSAAGKVRILKRNEMRPLDYDPATDERPTIWEFTQHMICYLEDDGEEAAARLLKKLGAASDATRELAYRLYNTCERKKWAEDARSYNALILAWPELERLASRMGEDTPVPTPKRAGAKGKPTKGMTKQRELFEGTDE